MSGQLFNTPGFNVVYFGNTLGQYAQSLIILLGLLLLFKIFQRAIIWRLESLAKKTKTDVDDTLLTIIESIKPPFYVIVALYFGFTFLSAHPLVKQGFNIFIIFLVVYQIIKSLQILIDYIFDRQLRKKEHKTSEAAFKTLASVLKGILWALGALVVLQNLGINVTSLIAGLGIGGIAIALAAQNILGDLFSSFAILFDKPFIPGDFIVLGDKMGTVEKIGIKTTRIRSIGGEELVISNQELTNSIIQNFGKLKKRRIVFQLGVTYETPAAKLKEIPGMTEKIIKEFKRLEFDRAHLKDFGESSINFEIVYYVLSNNYNVYMDLQQSINLKIVGRFEKEGIEMAYPTRTVYLKKQPNLLKIT